MKRLILIIALLPTLAFAETSIYRGLATTHLFLDNSYFNNNNGVTMLKVDNLVMGFMTNSYNEQGLLLGYQSKLFDNGTVELYGGVVGITGYRRWQMPFMRKGATYDERMEKVLVALPVVSLSHKITDNVAIQGNLMAGIVLNAGVRIDF